MTEKKAAFGNNFTPEQRAAALKRAAEMRAARAEYLDRVKSGEVAIATALADGKENPVVGRIKAKRLLMALPGVGAAKAQSAMTAIGIAESRRVAGIGQRQGRKTHRTFRVDAHAALPQGAMRNHMRGPGAVAHRAAALSFRVPGCLGCG